MKFGLAPMSRENETAHGVGLYLGQRALPKVVGMVFVVAAAMKLQNVLAGNGPVLPAAWPHSYVVSVVGVELALGLTLIVRPASLISNGLGCCLLLGMAGYHGARVLGGVQTPCGCLGAWSPPSEVMLALTGVGGGLLFVLGPSSVWLNSKVRGLLEEEGGRVVFHRQ